MTIFLNDLPSKESVMENMQKMNSFGSRLTGTKGQNAYTAWLKDEIAKMGYDVVDKQYTFKKWEATDWSLTVDGQNIDVSSPFPYSGLTDEKGVTGKLVTVFNNPLDFAQGAKLRYAASKIFQKSAVKSHSISARPCPKTLKSKRVTAVPSARLSSRRCSRSGRRNCRA